MHFSSDTFHMMKHWRVRSAGQVPCVGNKRNANRISVQKLHENKPLGRHTHRSQDNSNMNLNTLRTRSFKLFKRPFPGFLAILTL